MKTLPSGNMKTRRRPKRKNAARLSRNSGPCSRRPLTGLSILTIWLSWNVLTQSVMKYQMQQPFHFWPTRQTRREADAETQSGLLLPSTGSGVPNKEIISWPQPTHKINSAEVLVFASVHSFDFFPTWDTRIIFVMLYILSVLSYC